MANSEHKRISTEAQCPFYLSEDSHRIKCEGFKKKMKTHMVFPSSKNMRVYRQEYCCDRYKDCLLCKALYEKYGIEDF